MQQSSSTLIVKALKNPGTWFFFGNAFLNGQTHPVIPYLYAGAFVAQQTFRYVREGHTSYQVSKMMAGDNGPLLLNGIETGAVGIFTKISHPVSPLATACFSFSLANTAQALIYGGVFKFLQSPRGKKYKDFALAACEATILYGLTKVAENAGFSPDFTTKWLCGGLVIVGARAIASAFDYHSKWLAPDIAYIDMMGLAVTTAVEAIHTGHPLIAVSRAFALVAFSRLAVKRAEQENRKSIFEVERWAPKLLLRTQLTCLGLS